LKKPHITHSQIKMQFMPYGSHTMSSTSQKTAVSLLQSPDTRQYLGQQSFIVTIMRKNLHSPQVQDTQYTG